LLSVTDSNGNAVIHTEAKCGSLDILQKPLEWVKEKLTAKEIVSFISHRQ